MLEPKIIYEDKDLLVVNKPAGMLTHHIRPETKDKQSITTGPALTDWLLKKYPEIKNVGDDKILRPGIVHRLDRDTSGVIIAAKNQSAFLYLKNLFKERMMRKTYIALAWGHIKEKRGVIQKQISIKSGTIKRTVFHGKATKAAKPAITKFKVLKYIDGFSLLEVEPLTGRTHQIRIHLASIGHPIVGDRLYAQKKPDILKRLYLHAESLEFTSPSGTRLKISADPPSELDLKLLEQANHQQNK